jgi:hypothetical protein
MVLIGKECCIVPGLQRSIHAPLQPFPITRGIIALLVRCGYGCRMQDSCANTSAQKGSNMKNQDRSTVKYERDRISLEENRGKEK